MNRHPAPAWRLTVDGKDITGDISDRLNSLTLTDNRGFEADQLDISLDDTDGRLDLPPRGALVTLAIGWADTGLCDKGSYVVDEVEHRGTPDTLTIRARSADLRGGLITQMERSFHDTTLGAIVRKIAEENELAAVISDALAGAAVAHLDQTNESSANLLTRLARMYDATATVKGNRLIFMTTALGKTASGKPIPAVTIERQDGDQHTFSLTERDAFTAVRATFYDTHLAEKGEVLWGKDEEAEAKGKKKAVASVPAAQLPKLKALPGIYKSRTRAHRACIKAWTTLAKSRTEYDGVKAAYDDRVTKMKGEVMYGRADQAKNHEAMVKAAERDAARINGNAARSSGFDHSADNIKTLRHVYASKHNAQLAARSEYLKLGRGLAVFNLTLARGRPELIPDTPASVKGFKPQIDATDWILTRATHNITDAGYTTAIEMEMMAAEITG